MNRRMRHVAGLLTIGVVGLVGLPAAALAQDSIIRFEEDDQAVFTFEKVRADVLAFFGPPDTGCSADNEQTLSPPPFVYDLAPVVNDIGEAVITELIEAPCGGPEEEHDGWALGQAQAGAIAQLRSTEDELEMSIAAAHELYTLSESHASCCPGACGGVASAAAELEVNTEVHFLLTRPATVIAEIDLDVRPDCGSVYPRVEAEISGIVDDYIQAADHEEDYHWEFASEKQAGEYRLELHMTQNVSTSANSGCSDRSDESICETGDRLKVKLRFVSCNECRADFDGNGEVDFNDLVQLLSAWGPCEHCCEDLDNDGEVDFNDLVALLSAWGPCP